MHVDGFIVLAGVIVGFAVGLTGMGGGALMTPVLVLLLGVSPGAAVSSDLVASLFMKPVGSIVHIRRQTVQWPLVTWLVVGSVPSGFLGAYVINATATGAALANDLKLALGIALTVAVAGIVAKSVLDRRRSPTTAPADFAVRPLPTLLIGLLGGFVVGMTSVGSGSLMIVALMFLYPGLAGRELVGTDLVQSIPLVGSAALGQAIFGHVSLGVTVSLLIGSLPAIYVGSRLSASTASTGYLRPVITAVLLVSAVKLLGLGNTGVALIALACVVAGSAYLLVRRRRSPLPQLEGTTRATSASGRAGGS
ncbi:MAG: putative permease [Acidimicrobiaceae bacterium]|nr:putative permease [Acidimicrobiaceae bacterium]